MINSDLYFGHTATRAGWEIFSADNRKCSICHNISSRLDAFLGSALTNERFQTLPWPMGNIFNRKNTESAHKTNQYGGNNRHTTQDKYKETDPCLCGLPRWAGFGCAESCLGWTLDVSKDSGSPVGRISSLRN